MTRGSAGGAGAAGGINHEARCLAWAAAYMLAEAALPQWASGRRVVAVGAQTGRAVDDVGLVTDEGGWVMVQAKKGLALATPATSRLAEALEQLIEVEALGVPDRPPSSRSRPLDPDIDRVLVLTDHEAPARVDQDLAPVTDRLRALPSVWPLEDVHRNSAEQRAFKLVGDHLSRLWKLRHGTPLGEADLRRLGRVLCIRRIDLVDGGRDFTAIQNTLAGVTSRPEDVPRIWRELEREGKRLAEERSFLDRKGLIRWLELAGIALLPVTRLRPDIARLRALTQKNAAFFTGTLTIAAPEGPVSLPRAVSPIITSADGNVALTGAPGAGKTVILHALSTALNQQGVDIVVLRANNLRSTSGQTREELNLEHDLADVLTGWTGTGPGVVLIDGLDQTRGVDASSWVPDLADALIGTRWRIVATIRTFDLKHGPRWRHMFAGETIHKDRAHADLAGVRHIPVDDLTEAELAPLRAASPKLAKLLDNADSRLRALLANPFNIDLAAQLLTSDAEMDFDTIRNRVDLLDRYWTRRVGAPPIDLQRIRTLRAVVELMIRSGRQIADPLELPAEATPEALTSLHSNGVLRDLPATPGHASAPVEFSHPVLFDYAVAILALGHTNQPESLADRLDQDPNLAITVRPSLDYRLATVWRDDATRQGFWRLSLRLASHQTGHPLAASAAAKVAAREIQTFTDCQALADACSGLAEDEHGRWGTIDAQGLAFLLAAAISRGPSTEDAFASLAALTSRLARRARETDDIDLALLAAQLPARSLSNHVTALAVHTAGHLAPAAVDCMTVALADLTDPRRAQLAEVTSRLLAHTVAVEPSPTTSVVQALCSREALHDWGVRHLWRLIDSLPDIARRAPDLAVSLGASVWEYEETRDEPTSLLGSAILNLTTTRKQDLDSARYRVGEKFADLAAVDATAATSLLLRILDGPHTSQGPAWMKFAGPPQLRHGDALRFSAGHGALLSMTNTCIERLANLADMQDHPIDTSGWRATPQPLADIVDQIVGRLWHEEVWQRLLSHAATATSPTFAQALLPALVVPNLYAYPSTWLTAAHVARRLSPLLPAEEHARLESAIWGLVDTANAGHQPDPARDEHLNQRRDMLINCLHRDHLVTPEVRHRLPELRHDSDTLSLPELDEDQLDGIGQLLLDTEPLVEGSVEDIRQQVSAAGQQAESSDEQERAQAANRLISIWSQLRSTTETAEAPGSDPADATMDDVRVELARRLAHIPDAAPRTPLGTEIYATLRASLPAPRQFTTEEADRIWLTAPAAAWSGTTPNYALEGIAVLTLRADWRADHADELASLLVPFLDSPNPTFRYLAIRALPGLYPNPDDLFDQLRQRLLTENDRHIVTHLLSRLGGFRHSHPENVDQMLRRLAQRPEWILATDDPQGDQRNGRDDRWVLVVNLLAILAVVNTTPHATAVVRTWLTNPVDHPNRATQATACLRDVLNPADAALQLAQQRAFQLLEQGMKQPHDTWAIRQQPGPLTADHQDRLSQAAKVAENIGQQLYFASGAFDATKTDPTPARGDLHRFSTLALPLLEHLSTISHPAVTHHLIETIEHLRAVQPRRMLMIAAKAVTSDHAYVREPLALDATHLLIRHYLADHRELVLGDPTCIAAVRAMLEAFVRLGWDQAAELAEELDELYG